MDDGVESCHDEALERYKVAKDLESDNHDSFIESKKFYEGRGQWPEAVRTAREKAGLPCLTINRLPQFVNQVVNEIRKNTPQIKVRPVDSGADVATAEMYGGLIRNIEDQSQAQIAYEEAAKNAAIGGTGYIQVCYDYYDNGYWPELRIETLDPEKVMPGPYKKADASDAEYWFIETLVDEDGWEYGEWNEAQSLSTNAWKQDDKVLVCAYWYRKPKKMTLALMHDGSVLDITDKKLETLQEMPQEVKEIDGHEIRRALLTSYKVVKDEAWPSKYIPIGMVVGEEIRIDDKPVRTGLVHPAMDAQRQYNYQRSKATERTAMVSKAPWIVHEDAIKGNENMWATANTTNQAYLPWKGEIPPTQNIPGNVSAGEAQLADIAAQDLYAVTGITPSAMGEQQGVESGEAFRGRLRESRTATYNYPDNLARCVSFIGRVLVDMVPRVYTTQRWMRIKGADEQTKLVQLNVPYIDETGQNVYYDTQKGTYDVTVTVGPSYSTQREETAAALVDIMRTSPDSAQVLGPQVIKLFDFPDAAKIGQKLEEAMSHKQQAPDPLMIAQQTEQMKTQANIQIKQASNMADAQLAQQKFELSKQEAIFNAQQKREMAQFEADLQMRIAHTNAQLELEKLNKQLELKREEAQMRAFERMAQPTGMNHGNSNFSA